MKRIDRTLTTVAACAILTFGCTLAGSQEEDGTGWTITRLDLEVRVDNDPASMTMGGTL